MDGRPATAEATEPLVKLDKMTASGRTQLNKPKFHVIKGEVL